MSKHYDSGFWCDCHQEEVESSREFVKGTRYEDDECLHGLCKVCHKRLLENNLSTLPYFSENYF